MRRRLQLQIVSHAAPRPAINRVDHQQVSPGKALGFIIWAAQSGPEGRCRGPFSRLRKFGFKECYGFDSITASICWRTWSDAW